MDVTEKHEEELFVVENLRQMEEVQAGVSGAADIRLLEIYFFLEVAKEPIRAYYEIVRLKREKISFKSKCELESMVEMAKLCFMQIFKSHNVQNQDLELMKLIDYEESIETLEGLLLQAVQRSIHFLRLFMSHSVKIAELEE